MFQFRSNIIEKIIYLFPFLALVILVYLSFYCHPSAEDLTIYYYNKTLGLELYIREFYLNDSSRYFSFPLLFWLFDGEFIINHYYIVPVALFTLLWLSILFLINVIAKYVMSTEGHGHPKVWLAAFGVMTFAATAFEPVSIFYWISGSITYLPSFICYLFLCGLLIRATYRGKTEITDIALCTVLTVCITGSNEISICFLFSGLVMGLWLHYRATSRVHYLLVGLLVLQISCIIFLIIPGGSGKRAHGFSASFSLFEGGIIAATYSVRTFFRICAEPFAWLLLLFAWLGGNTLNAQVNSKVYKPGSTAVIILATTLFSVFSLYFMIYKLSGELLPPRANNLMVFYGLLFLIASAFLSGASQAKLSFYCIGEVRRSLSLIVLVVFFTASFTRNILKDIFSGYVYNQVMISREAVIQRAGTAGEKKAVITSYSKSADSLVHQLLGATILKSFAGKLVQYPVFIHYEDPLSDASFSASYYVYLHNIDTIQYNGKLFIMKRKVIR